MDDLEDIKLKCRNFKCFGDQPQGFEELKPINIIIGRNNSGKSTLLDLVEFAINPKDEIPGRGHRGKTPQFLLSRKLTKHLADSLPNQLQTATAGNRQREFYPRKHASAHLLDKWFECEIKTGGDTEFTRVCDYHEPDEINGKITQWIGRHLAGTFRHLFKAYEFRRIAADRDISRERTSAGKLSIEPNGQRCTNVIERYLNYEKLDPTLIQTTLRGDLNAILRPDADYRQIIVRQDDGEHWEIWIEEPSKGLIRLSETGSGLKTILLVLVNLLVIPEIPTNKGTVPPLSKFMFGFEELENNLHPAIQRRLFLYLRDKAIREGCHFFITTHSNVVVDLFSGDKDAQIVHVTHNGEFATVNRVATFLQNRNVLDDLDFRASDLLQTNAVVWVEGPSDRIYFNKWVKLWSAGELVEGVHYQCLPFGGSLNAHLSFESGEQPSDDAVDELIAAMRINRHAILVMDSDKRTKASKLKPHTERLGKEITDVGGYAWITQGKEIENYIPHPVLQALYEDGSTIVPGRFDDILELVRQRDGNKAKPRKVDLAHRIVSKLTRESLETTLDMAERLDEVCARIRRWNRVEAQKGNALAQPPQ